MPSTRTCRCPVRQAASSAACQTFCGITTNAGKARFRGVELETNFRVAKNLATSGDRFTVPGSLGYLDAKYLQFETLIAGQDGRRCERSQDPEHAEVDAERHARLRHARLRAVVSISTRPCPTAAAASSSRLRSPGLDQPGFALWDANFVWRSTGNRYEFGLHAKNITNKKYIIGGLQFPRSEPITGDFLLNGAGQPIPTFGRTGVLTAYYGNPRQVFLSAALNF